MHEINKEAGIGIKKDESDNEIRREEGESKKDEESESKRLDKFVNGELTEQDVEEE
jgi:hypothetical protein